MSNAKDVEDMANCLLRHGFIVELQQRGDGYAILLPLDGNYFNIAEALDALRYWQDVIGATNMALGKKYPQRILQGNDGL